MQQEISSEILERLDFAKDKVRNQWGQKNLVPTRFFIVDDLLSVPLAQKIYDCFPQSKEIWNQQSSFRERKKTFAKLNEIEPLISDVTNAFQSKEVINKIQELTGIKDLGADPLLYAGGISMMGKGDFLNPHIDNSHNMDRSAYRKLNLLYYITPGWELSNGGNFELWDRKVKRPLEIESRFNRLIVMETNKDSWHSVNQVRVNANRCCVSNYYFAHSPHPYEGHYYHVTSFSGRPGESWNRLYGRIDNAARQFLASSFGVSRGKKLVNLKEMSLDKKSTDKVVRG